MPKILDDCVESAMRGGSTKSQAFAQCTASLQKAGVLKKGTQDLTDKGNKRSNFRSAMKK